MQTKKLILLCVLIFAPRTLWASDIEIIEFIVENSPKVKIMRELNTHPLRDVKVEGKASAYMGAVGDTTDRGSVGVVVSIPLLDVKERLEKQKTVADTIEMVRKEAIAALKAFRSATAGIKSLTLKINAKKEYLAWMKKRVEAGIEYQNTYLKAEHELLEHAEALEKAKASADIHRTTLLLLVKPEARKKLLSMLSRE